MQRNEDSSITKNSSYNLWLGIICFLVGLTIGVRATLWVLSHGSSQTPDLKLKSNDLITKIN